MIFEISLFILFTLASGYYFFSNVNKDSNDSNDTESDKSQEDSSIYQEILKWLYPTTALIFSLFIYLLYFHVVGFGTDVAGLNGAYRWVTILLAILFPLMIISGVAYLVLGGIDYFEGGDVSIWNFLKVIFAIVILYIYTGSADLKFYGTGDVYMPLLGVGGNSTLGKIFLWPYKAFLRVVSVFLNFGLSNPVKFFMYLILGYIPQTNNCITSLQKICNDNDITGDNIHVDKNYLNNFVNCRMDDYFKVGKCKDKEGKEVDCCNERTSKTIAAFFRKINTIGLDLAATDDQVEGDFKLEGTIEGFVGTIVHVIGILTYYLLYPLRGLTGFNEPQKDDVSSVIATKWLMNMLIVSLLLAFYMINNMGLSIGMLVVSIATLVGMKVYGTSSDKDSGNIEMKEI